MTNKKQTIKNVKANQTITVNIEDAQRIYIPMNNRSFNTDALFKNVTKSADITLQS